MGMEWRGGDIQRYPGGGFKINLLKPVLEKWKDQKETVVMFVDRYVYMYVCMLIWRISPITPSFQTSVL